MDSTVTQASSGVTLGEQAKGAAAIACLATLLEESAHFLPPDAVQGLAHAIHSMARLLEATAMAAPTQ